MAEANQHRRLPPVHDVHGVHDVHEIRMICASCAELTHQDPCSACGREAHLDGRYRLDEIVGRGSMGVTYRATSCVDGSTVAVKEIAFRHIRELKEWELGRREAEVLEQLDHPSIPRYRDHFLFGQGKNAALFIVQEFIEGRSLAKEMEKKRYGEDEVLAILEGILPVLEYLHTRSPPIIHRDLKPSNVMRRESDGSLVLIDFGTVRDALKDPQAGGSTVAGTYGFMAPEQYEGRAIPATDLYGLGALALALLTREDPSSMMRSGVRLDWEHKVAISPGSKVLLRQLLAPHPDDRLSSAAEVLARVRAIRSGKASTPAVLSELLEQPPVERQALAKKKSSKSPVLVWLMVTFFLAGAFAFFGGSAPSQPEIPRVRPYAAYSESSPPEDVEAWCTKSSFPRACVRLGKTQEERGEAAQAAQSFERACSRSYGPGCAALARAYAEGAGVPRSTERADQLYETACQLAYKPACGVKAE